MGLTRKGGVITGSSAMVQHDSDYQMGNMLYIGEQYSNGVAATSLFVSASTGAGSAVADGGAVEIDISSGSGSAGAGIFHMKDTARKLTLASKPITWSCRVRNIVAGAGVDRHTVIGFYEDFSHVPFAANSSGIFFHQLVDDTWRARICNATDDTFKLITVSENDILSINASTKNISMYQNGNILINYGGPDAMPLGISLDIGASCIATAATVSGARSMSLPSFIYQRFV